jgi:prepilin-type N-terminal cleavage/methylation domain-containing protein
MTKQHRLPYNQKGMSLIELLVSLLIVTTISSVALGIIWISLRSTVKVNNMNLIRQNGNFAITQMTKTLQYSRKFDGVSTDGVTYVMTCQDPASATLQSYSHVRVTSQSNTPIILGCLTTPSTVASNSASLLNTAVYTVSSCKFTCTQADVDSPYTIGIEFTIKKIIGGNLFDDPAPVTFQSSATIRNIL